jgi:hypothetical protein
MIRSKIDAWLNESKSDLIKNYDRLGLRASGQWAKDLETKTEVNKHTYKIKILGSNYTGVLETGRKPNENQGSLKAWVGWAGSTFLKDWVKRKGINASPYAIAWKIGREGIKVPNQYNLGGLVSDVMTRDRIDKLINDIGLVVLGDIKSDVIKQFK